MQHMKNDKFTGRYTHLTGKWEVVYAKATVNILKYGSLQDTASVFLSDCPSSQILYVNSHVLSQEHAH